MEKAAKEKVVSELNKIFSESVVAILVNSEGLIVDDLTVLRKKLYEKNGKLKVLKNTLAKKGLSGTLFEPLNDKLTKTRALVYSSIDCAGVGKALVEEAKNASKLEIIGGAIVSGDKVEMLDVEAIKALATLPSREELLAKLLFLLNAPVTNFVRTLNEVPASFVRTLQAIVDTKN